MSQNYNPVSGTGGVATSNAAATTLFSWTVNEQSVSRVVVNVIARRHSTGDVKTWFKSATARRSSGDADIVAFADILTADGTLGAALWGCTIDASGTDARVRVTGAVGADIEWFCSVEGDEIQTS